MLNNLKDNNASLPLIAALMNYCDELITVKDLNYKYLDCNQAFLNHLNLKSKDEVVGKTIFEVLTPSSAECLKNNIIKAIETGTPQVYKFFINKNNAPKVVHQTSTPVILNGEVKYILSISRDVTQDELMKNELITKNGQLNTLLKHIPMLVYMKDKDRNYIIGSKNAENFVKHGLDTYAGNIVIDLENSAKETEEEDEFVLKENKLLVKEKKALGINGEPHWYNILKAPIVKEDNCVSGFVTIAHNIDQHKMIENQKDMFIATLVHDLKNPLLAQISCLELFNKELFGELNNTQKEMLEIILESANYMKEMIYMLINTYKYDNGNIQLSKTVTDIEALIHTCIKEHSSLALEHKVKISLLNNISNDRKNIVIDNKQIRRVFSNLINNGINYAFENSDFNIILDSNDENIKISFENCGPQIDENIKEHIFEKYISGANKYQKVGFGLGMYLSKKVIEAHEGTIKLEVTGNLNKFTIEIPYQPDNKYDKIYL